MSEHISREEEYLAYGLGEITNLSDLPKPISRIDELLLRVAQLLVEIKNSPGGSGGSDTGGSGTTDTTLANEVKDIRIGADGTIYVSAGEAVRAQVNQLNNTLGDIISVKEVISLNLNDEQYEIGRFTVSGALYDDATAFRSVNYLPIEGGKSIKFYSEDCNYLTICEYDESYQLLSRTDLYGMKENGDGIIKELLLNANTRYIKFFRYSTNLDEKISIYYSENAKSEYIPYVAPHTEITLEYEKIYNNDGSSIDEVINQKVAQSSAELNGSIYAKNTVFELSNPIVTAGSLEYQQKISKDDRPCWLWELNTAGKMEINGISVPREADDVVGIWIYVNQEAVTWGNDTDGELKVYIDGAQILSLYPSYRLHVGWNYLKLDLSNAGDTFDLKFEFTMVRDTYQFAVDTIELNYKTRTQVLLSFDMFGEDGYNVRYPLVDSYGFKATFCNPDQGLTADMRNELFAKGWDWAIYDGRSSAGITRPDFYTGTVDEWYDYLKPAVDSCAEIGLFNPISYFSPNNVGTPAIMEALKKLGVKIGRMAASNNYYTEYFDKNSFYIYTFGVGSTSEAKDTLAMLDTAIAEGRSVCIFAHQIQDTLTNNMHCPMNVYTAILDGIKERVDSGLCDVVTFSEFYRHWCPEDYAEIIENRNQKERHNAVAILFDSTTGDNISATLTLSDDAAKYNHIEVLYGIDNQVSSARAANGKTVAMSITQSDAGSFKMTTGSATLNGTLLTRGSPGSERQLIINHATEGQLDFTGSTPDSGYYISIYRVIGYK